MYANAIPVAVDNLYPDASRRCDDLNHGVSICLASSDLAVFGDVGLPFDTYQVLVSRLTTQPQSGSPSSTWR